LQFVSARIVRAIELKPVVVVVVVAVAASASASGHPAPD
jgi:hypothetical protein